MIPTEKADSRVMESVLLMDLTVVRQSVTYSRHGRKGGTTAGLVLFTGISINSQ